MSFCLEIMKLFLVNVLFPPLCKKTTTKKKQENTANSLDVVPSSFGPYPDSIDRAAQLKKDSVFSTGDQHFGFSEITIGGWISIPNLSECNDVCD